MTSFLELGRLMHLYGRRFGHNIPTFALQRNSPEHLAIRIRTALVAKQPVIAWKLHVKDPRCVEDRF